MSASLQVLGAVLGFAALAGALLLAELRRARRELARLTGALAAFAAGLDGGLVIGAPSLLDHLRRVWVTGTLDGRGVRVSFSRRVVGSTTATVVHYAVEVANPVESFEVGDVGAIESVGRLLGLVAADPLEDRGRALRRASLDARRRLQATEVKQALTKVLGCAGVSRARLDSSSLAVEQVCVVDAEAMRTTLREVVALARLLGRAQVGRPAVGDERASIPVDLTARLAWTGGGETARCPYCRDELDAAAPDAAACERCRTVHHRECLDEAGGCTVFGCGARTAATPRRAGA